MPSTVELSFIKNFEADVHIAFQQQGSKLYNTVRTKNNVIGKSTTFQKVGRGEASTKSRHANVTAMQLEHSQIEVTLADYYAGDYSDKLDELKTNIDERKVVAQSGAYALGRKADMMIIDALKTGGVTKVGDGTTALTKALILKAFGVLNIAEVPDDGLRYAIVSPVQWNDLMNIEEFSRSDYVGNDLPFLKGSESRKWLGIVWIMHTGCPSAAGKDTGYIYHKTAVGHAIGKEVSTDITWVGEKQSHFICSCMSQGAGLVDKTGAVAFETKSA